jgi:hypothetical protein
VQGSETVVLLDQPELTCVFKGISSRPVPSVLRDFSAPVRVEQQLSQEEKIFLLRQPQFVDEKLEAPYSGLPSRCYKLGARRPGNRSQGQDWKCLREHER